MAGATEQFIVPRQERGDAARGDQQLALTPAVMNLGDAAVVRVAQGADLGDDIEAQCMLGQRQAAYLLGPVRFTKWRTRRMETASDVQGEPHDSC
jgi:hypothetical protein